MLDVTGSIVNYIENKLPWAIMAMMGADSGSIIILKGHAKEDFKIALAEHQNGNVVSSTQKQLEQGLRDLLMKSGKEYPLIMVENLQFKCRYGAKFPDVVLDATHPRFFDHLDKMIDYILTHDNISQFSLQV